MSKGKLSQQSFHPDPINTKPVEKELKPGNQYDASFSKQRFTKQEIYGHEAPHQELVQYQNILRCSEKDHPERHSWQQSEINSLIQIIKSLQIYNARKRLQVKYTRFKIRDLIWINKFLSKAIPKISNSIAFLTDPSQMVGRTAEQIDQIQNTFICEIKESFQEMNVLFPAFYQKEWDTTQKQKKSLAALGNRSPPSASAISKNLQVYLRFFQQKIQKLQLRMQHLNTYEKYITQRNQLKRLQKTAMLTTNFWEKLSWILLQCLSPTDLCAAIHTDFKKLQEHYRISV